MVLVFAMLHMRVHNANTHLLKIATIGDPSTMMVRVHVILHSLVLNVSILLSATVVAPLELMEIVSAKSLGWEINVNIRRHVVRVTLVFYPRLLSQVILHVCRKDVTVKRAVKIQLSAQVFLVPQRMFPKMEPLFAKTEHVLSNNVAIKAVHLGVVPWVNLTESPKTVLCVMGTVQIRYVAISSIPTLRMPLYKSPLILG